MDLALIGGAIGGVGLFLLGMRLMTEGLKVAAGAMLRDILTRWTRTRFRALCSGALITGIVQSSSAVTVASIGFVNAGMLTLGQAMWVIFGANVGTTMTGWIVAVVGFDIRIEAFALPLLGIGMFLSLAGTTGPRGALGEALAGFGVFFLGIATLKATFAGVGDGIDIAAFATGGVLGDALFVLVGFVLSSLVQSSSAVIAMALTATAGGIIDLESGAALVIGANVGTTTTALLAVIGATSNAKRVAFSHVVFNALTGVCALGVLPLLLAGVEGAERAVSATAGATAALALFDTVFNLLGAALMWPLADRLERWLALRFVTQDEDEARPRYLDKTGLEVPALAINSVLLELGRVARVALGIARAVHESPAVPVERLWRRRAVVDSLNDAIVAYVQRLGAAKTATPIADVLPHPIRILLHLLEIADISIAAAARREVIRSLPADLSARMESYATLLLAQTDAAERLFAGASDATAPQESTLLPVYDRIKAECLAAATQGRLTADQVEAALESLGDMKEITRRLDRIGKRFIVLRRAAGPIEAPPAPPPPPAQEVVPT